MGVIWVILRQGIGHMCNIETRGGHVSGCRPYVSNEWQILDHVAVGRSCLSYEAMG